MNRQTRQPGKDRIRFFTLIEVLAAITIILYVMGQNLADASDQRTHM